MDPGAEPGGSTRISADCGKNNEVRRPSEPSARGAAFHGEVSRPSWKHRTIYGAELASTTVVKALFLLGVTCRDRLFIPANDNVALVAANDNVFVADRIAA